MSRVCSDVTLEGMRTSKRDLLRKSSVRQRYNDPFRGSNAQNEIESLSEFKEVIGEKGVVFQYVFQEVDFTEDPAFNFGSFHFEGNSFLGCKFPQDCDTHALKQHNLVLENSTEVPFKPFRAFLYTQSEMEGDKEIYRFYKEDTSLSDVTKAMYFAFHDFSILDAIYDYVEGKTCVAVMGGHAVKREDEKYVTIAEMGRKIAKAGFIATTGGSTGAMEAVNYGAYMYDRTDAEFREGLRMIAIPSSISPQYKDEDTPQKVVDKFGVAQSNIPSLGIPTFFYGHEPSNKFAGQIAKFFSNAVREDTLLNVCVGGIIITPGSLGTVQEVFQSTCRIGYGDPKYPIVFFGQEFWRNNGVYGVVEAQAKEHSFLDLLLISDDVDEIVDFLVAKADKHQLYRLQDARRELSNPYWFSKEHC